ncbi:cytosine/adenosine deaminase-related metal-dependent hydrolase [Pedobacter cryoconitis]|uniref:Cytosine/adenosine deaminase-related metal-dependent hydrolase n=1 Tax=Pedobacter cryoconitis TaxID=188932 RepID=A0A7W8ZML1_9SPHI|nr:amidohydrolase family protein [Pedobacter cryoconitis]MBB5636557.1 cytosine/adenosine deaminase-related metal-dependent hydrolase [Pedobacter cryoconitis]
MSSYLSAKWIYPVSDAPLQHGIIAVSDDGTITAVMTAEQGKALGIKDIQYYDGVLVPGLVNTHCHLELSHLFGKIGEHTGLPGFVQQVIQQRQASELEIEEAMRIADAEMYANGIVATGDISNQIYSKGVKVKSKVYYHTFVEAMGFNPGRAQEIIQKAVEMRDEFLPLKATIVPHAPYSVSEELFVEIEKVSGAETESVSIHNQETADENRFFEKKEGHFLNLYKFLGLDIDFFQAKGKTSLQCYLPLLSAAAKTLLVHNTFTSKQDIEFAKGQHPKLYWCLCPNANLYIENKLPDVALLMESGATITLGTDSLASNHQLSILAEMKTLQEYQQISFDTLLRWATLNGALFLGIDTQFGSFEKGKKPGVNFIEHLEDGLIKPYTRIQRII